MYDVLVLMSTYNGERFLKEQLDSILKQKGCNVHLLIRDDGSTDSTRNILNNYASLHDNISLMDADCNMGPAKSFFTLLLQSPSYEFYAFADQDDIWEEDKLISGIRLIKDLTKPAIYTSDTIWLDSMGGNSMIIRHKSTKTHVNVETILSTSQFAGCTMVFNNILADIIKTGGLPNSIIMHDYYICSVCALVGGCIMYDPTPHMLYRQHENNVVGVSTDLASKLKSRINCVFKKKKVPIYEQLSDISSRYSHYIKGEGKEFADIIIKSKTNVYCRIRLFLTRKVHYRKLNQSITNRLAFLLGNR